MSKTQLHIPIRTCIACGRKANKYELIRLVADKEGIIRQDNKGRLGGRGAYICSRRECLEKVILKPAILSKALKREHIRFVEPRGEIYE